MKEEDVEDKGVTSYPKKEIQTGKSKIEEICTMLRKETLEPAFEQAHAIELEARQKADLLLEEAKLTAAALLQQTEKEIANRKAIFEASLHRAAKQSIEWLKQEIEKKCLHEQLCSLIEHSTSNPQTIASIISALIEGIKKEGINTPLSAFIPAHIEPRLINEFLGKELLAQLKEKGVLIGSMKGGAELKLHQNHLILDMTSQALTELLTRYIGKDFIHFFFAPEET